MTDKAQIRTTLLKEKETLEMELADVKKGQPSPNERREGSPFGKREEEAAEAADIEKRLALETKLNSLITDVERAIQKLESGSYGVCDVCRQPIGPERLEALPAARMCLKCKSAQDRAQRPHR